MLFFHMHAPMGVCMCIVLPVAKVTKKIKHFDRDNGHTAKGKLLKFWFILVEN